MEQKLVVRETLDAAWDLIRCIRKGDPVDTNSFAKWTGALDRYVLNDSEQRTVGQELENLMREVVWKIEDKIDPKKVEPIVIKFVHVLKREIHELKDLDDQIVWEPPFDVFFVWQ